MHFTVSSSEKGTINWLTNKRAKASAHVVIGREGRITQLVPFNIKAWHAGTSRWKEVKGLNACSIGIELVNAGPLARSANGNWRDSYGHSYDSDEVIEAIHKHQEQPKGWHLYPQKQIEAAMELAELLVEKYKLEEILGHEDIAPGRKQDPGPAFPMDKFQAQVFGRDDTPEVIYETITGLNIRRGPGAKYKQLEGSPLPKGTRLEIEATKGHWCQVEVLDEVNGIMDLEGWISGRYIKRM